MLVFLSACSKSGSWDSIRNLEHHEGFGREITLEIDLTGITWKTPGDADSSDIVDFPLLVRLNTSVDFDYPEFLSNNGSGIRFYDSQGRQLAFETALWNPAGPSAWWVRIPSLDKKLSNNRILLRYDYWWDNPPVSLDSGETWSNGFAGVWHLDEGIGATVFRDSSVWKNDGSTGYDGMDLPAVELPPPAMGFGNARFFDASTGNPSFRVGFLADEDSEGQLEAFSLGYWLRTVAWGQISVFEKGDIQLEYNRDGDFTYSVRRKGNDLEFQKTLSQWSGGSHLVDWMYFYITSNGKMNGSPNSGTRIYNNTIKTSNWKINTTGTDLRGGNRGKYIQFCQQSLMSSAQFTFDEIRLSRGDRTQDWIILEYENMGSVVAVVRVSEQSFN